MDHFTVCVYQVLGTTFICFYAYLLEEGRKQNERKWKKIDRISKAERIGKERNGKRRGGQEMKGDGKEEKRTGKRSWDVYRKSSRWPQTGRWREAAGWLHCRRNGHRSETHTDHPASARRERGGGLHYSMTQKAPHK